MMAAFYRRFGHAAALLLGAFLTVGCSPPPSGDGKTVILSYNVQNIFDAEHDGSEYDEFIPGRRWSEELYHLRLHGLSEVIRNTTPPPDVVLLQEVEDRGVLEDLCTVYLPEYGYSQRITGGPEESATQVGLLTHLPVVEVRRHAPPVHDHPLRNILEVSLLIGRNELILLGNHWKSRAGGDEGESNPGGELRIQTARMVRLRLEDIFSERPRAKVILAGDFNSEPAGGTADFAPPLVLTESPGNGGVGGAENVPVTERTDTAVFEVGSSESAVIPFFSPWGLEEAGGSYRYRGSWERIDAFYLSPSLLAPPGPLFEQFMVHPWKELRSREGEPLRWIQELQSGYSDHLPLILTLDNED